MGGYDKASAIQQDGVMKIKATMTGKNGGFFGLFYRINTLEQFNQFETKMKLIATKGEESNVHFVFYPVAPIEWYLSCWLTNTGDGDKKGKAGCQAGGKKFKLVDVDLSQWHVFTLSYNNNKSEMRLYLDNAPYADVNILSMIKKIPANSAYDFSVQVGGGDGAMVEADYDYAAIWGKSEETTDSEEETLTDNPSVKPIEIPISVPSSDSLGQIKVLSYNILQGGGKDEAGPKAGQKDIRLPDVLKYIDAQQADIIGLQELNGWHNGEPNLMESIAKERDLNAYLSLDPSGYHNGLLTKYPILEAVNLSSVLGNVGGMYARIDSPFGPVNVFNIHFDPFSEEKRFCQEQLTLALAEPYRSELALIMGDFNTNPGLIARKGWTRIAGFGIDHVWASPAFKASRQSIIGGEETYELSDHLPVGVVLDIKQKVAKSETSPDSLKIETAVVPRSLEDKENAPWLSRYENLKVTSGIMKQDNCAMMRNWDLGQNTNITEEGIKMVGKNFWESGFSYQPFLNEREGVIVRFKYTGNSEFEIGFNHGVWDTPDFRRFGVYIQKNGLGKNYWQGAKGFNNGNDINLSLKQDIEYELLLSADGENKFSMSIWESENPSQPLMETLTEKFDETWAGLDWKLRLGANKGEMLVTDFVSFSFDGLKK